MADEQDPVPFREVYAVELDEIKTRRERLFYADPETADADDARSVPPENLTGLALSGGGIRSATFCLGLLQGLHKLRLLRIFDYVSTVSGGGYVGGWWSAWLAREQVDLRMKSESPFLTTLDIKHPVSLILKVKHHKDDEVAKSLRLQFRADGRFGTNDLISAYDETAAPDKALLAALVRELNRWIAAPPHEGAPELDGAPSLEGELRGRTPAFVATPTHENVRAWRSKTHAERCRHDAWRNRLLLESQYPYEFRDIFPRREMIEPLRSRPSAGEPEGASSAWVDPIHHLRLFASYLTPRRGALSADTWRAISVISRNLVLTWLVLLPVLITVLLPGHIFLRTVYVLAVGSADAPAVEQGAKGDFTPEAGARPSPAREVMRERLRVGPQSKFGYIALVASFFISMIVLMTILWLLTIRDTSAGNSLAVTMVCLGVVAALFFAGLVAFSEPGQLPGLRSGPGVIACVWLAVAVILVVWTYWPTEAKDARRRGRVGRRWNKDLRRNRISRIHTKLMVWLTLTTVALLLVAYGPDMVYITLGERGEGTGKGVNWLGFLPLVSAIAGSIFTAIKARPSGGGERRPSRDPSIITRFIFAVTPGLVMLVLAVGAAALGDLLIYAMLGRATPLTSAAIYYGGVLCFGLAVYEMEYPPDLKPTWPLIAFVCLLTVTISLIIGTMITLYGTTYKQPGVGWQSLWAMGLVVWPSLVAAVLLVHSLLRVFRRESGQSWLKGGGLAVLVGLVFFAGVTAWLTQPLGQRLGKTISPGALIPLVCVATLAGSLILFRLAVRRRDSLNQRLFDVRVRADDAWAQQPWAIWVLASICLMLPMLMFSVLHETVGQSFHNPTNESGTWRISAGLLFVLALGALPLMLGLYGAATADAKRRGASGGGKGGALGLIVDVSSKFGALPETTFGALAAAAVLGAIVVGFLAQLWVGDYAFSPSATGSGALLVALIAGGGLSLVLLRLAVMRMPVEGYARLVLPRRLRFIARGGGAWLWTLSALCVFVAFCVGYLAWSWSGHVEEYISNNLVTAPTATTLAGMAGCFTLTFFEIFWGRGQNRRTLWLLGTMYLLLLSIFGISLIPENREETAELYVYTRFLLDMGGMMATVMVWLVALGWMVDPNGVSMHNFYKSRLVRAYLGASNPRRLDQGSDITEAAAGDDVPLSALRNCQRGAPYHLINATLNLVAGRDLATAQRSASSFVLSRRYCGSMRTAYRPTTEYMSGEMSLGTAVATSGAAVSPSMGAKKPTAALAMLMTLLNVRLGFWSPTPNRETWRSAQPRLWPFYLIREFLSQTNDLSSYCYLTDGGHFDNTGLYPLVERGCRYIVLVDCGADPRPCFSDLGDAIRRCRIDFGTEIKLDIKPLLISNDEGPTTYFVAGGIRYSREHAEFLNWELTGEENSRAEKDARTGIIIYLKPSVLNPPELGRETADVRQYAIENSSFPQETTANQWFDEAQFESYRRLGQLTAKVAFEKIKVPSPDTRRETLREMSLADVVRLSPEHIAEFFTAVKESIDDSHPDDAL
jgi:hypothetical protein